MSIAHYENFPVGSLLLPRRIRKAVHVIYHFARQADDVADEGELKPSERLAQLQYWRGQLDAIEQQQTPTEPLMQDLAQVIRQHGLVLSPFYDLLSAFEQDVTQTRYEHFAQVLDYCQRSANPIGRLMLALYGVKTDKAYQQADAICTALQLINMLQDIQIDWEKGRLYIPQDEWLAAGLPNTYLDSPKVDACWKNMMHKQLQRAQALLDSGAPLGRQLTGRLGYEVRLIIAGARTILAKLYAVDGDIFHQRPVLRWYDALPMLIRAL